MSHSFHGGFLIHQKRNVFIDEFIPFIEKAYPEWPQRPLKV
jgi:hypothetical protein